MHNLFNFLLQLENLKIPSGGDWGGLLIFLGAIFLIVLILIITNRFYQPESDRTSTKRWYPRFMFDRIGRDMGLGRNHIQYLSQCAKSLKVKYPILLFTNQRLLDAVLKRAIASVEKKVRLSDSERVDQLNLIYEIKQVIELNSKHSIGIKSTFLIRPGQSVILTAANGDRFHSKIITNHTDSLTLSYPLIQVEKESQFKKGNKIKIFFWRENDSGYSFLSKIIDFNKAHTLPFLSIQHSRTLKREQHRKYSRKPLKKSCIIYPMETTGEQSRNSQTKVTFDLNLHHTGVVSDISVGGCSIATSHAYKKGTYLKVEFDIESVPIKAYVKVQSILRRGNPGAGLLIHAQFVRLSNKSRNRIYSYIYNFIKDEPIAKIQY